MQTPNASTALAPPQPATARHAAPSHAAETEAHAPATRRPTARGSARATSSARASAGAARMLTVGRGVFARWGLAVRGTCACLLRAGIRRGCLFGWRRGSGWLRGRVRGCQFGRSKGGEGRREGGRKERKEGLFDCSGRPRTAHG